MELQVGVKVLLKNAAGKYLLLYRSPEKYPEVKGGRWDIVGGRIEPGTSLLDNLRREVKEEIGIDLMGTPRLVAAQDILRVPGRHVVRLTYVGEIEGEPQLDSDHVEYQWGTRDELYALSKEQLDIYFHELLHERETKIL